MEPEEDQIDLIVLQFKGEVVQLERETVDDECGEIVEEDSEDDVSAGSVEEKGPSVEDAVSKCGWP